MKIRIENNLICIDKYKQINHIENGLIVIDSIILKGMNMKILNTYPNKIVLSCELISIKLGEQNEL